MSPSESWTNGLGKWKILG